MRMLDTVYLYGRFMSVSVRSQMQYRASFVMLSLGYMVTTGLEFVAILVLFDRFGLIREDTSGLEDRSPAGSCTRWRSSMA